MNQAARREFLKQASADLAALALLPILPSGDRFRVVGAAYNETVSHNEGWCSLEKLNSGEIVRDNRGNVFIFDGASLRPYPI